MSDAMVNVGAGTANGAVGWSESELVHIVNAAFRQIRSTLALARSPLAASPLVVPLLVLDDSSPTADERGQAVRLLLQWAVEQLAPAPPAYPIGVYRDWDDPTWRDPHWWRYNILRHRYIEPLHPDDFVEGGRYTETILALTGIPSPDTFFDERNRAIRAVAQLLGQELRSGQAAPELRQLALEAVYAALQNHPEAETLLGIAAVFDDVVPRALLVQMAEAEHIAGVDATLDYLSQHRFVQTDEEGQYLRVAPVLRRFLYERRRKAEQTARHGRAATHFLAEGEPLAAARHLQAGGRWREAADLILRVAPELVNELQADELLQRLNAFRRAHLDAAPWRAVQVLRADLLRQRGQRSDALAACRAALRASDDPADQARIYRRMGKLYEKHNQLHALGYYQQAEERFPGDDPELGVLLKDRAWLYILRQEWSPAEADLTRALELAPTGATALRADIYDALAGLHRHQKHYADAITHGRNALGLRESMGDLLRVANSSNNLGLIYIDMGDYGHAIAALQEANATYTALGNRELAAGALLNIGLAHHLSGRLPAAVQAYAECLLVCQAIDLPLVAARAHSNLVEAHMDQEQIAKAVDHWQTGHALSVAAGFDDELAYYRQLLDQYPALRAALDQAALAVETPPAPMADPLPDLAPTDQAIMDLAQRAGSVTARQVVEELALSKATATRRLAELANQGLLRRHGEGRGTQYTPTVAAPRLPAPTGDSDVDAGLRQKLHAATDYLARTFDVTALGIAADGAPRDGLRLVVAFANEPDLATFFRLEDELARVVELPLDVRPLLAPARAAGQSEGIVWVWQAASFLE